MEISVTDAKGQLTDLVRRAERGEEVVLTRHGQPKVRLVTIAPFPDRTMRRKVMEAALLSGSVKALKGASGARSQDFLYDEDGLPR